MTDVIDQSGLTCVSLANDIHMAPLVFLFDPKPYPNIAASHYRKVDEEILIIFQFGHISE